MATVATKPLTAEEFFQAAEPRDGMTYELVRGEIEAMPGPGLRHGEVQGNTFMVIKLFLKQNRVGRVFTESGAITERNPDTVRGPDVSYYSKENLPLDKEVVGYHDQPPDLCVEIVSPSNSMRKLKDKAKEYLFAGVRLVWVIDPEDKSVTVITDPLESRTLETGATLDGGAVLSGFSCRVSDLFG